MQYIERKCIAITKENSQYIRSLVQQRKAKNFSRAISDIIEERRKNDISSKLNNSDC